MGSKDAPQPQHTATHAIECSNATLRMCSKDAPQKMQFLCAIKKVASPSAFIQNAKVAEKSHILSRHRSKIGPNPDVLAYSKSP